MTDTLIPNCLEFYLKYEEALVKKMLQRWNPIWGEAVLLRNRDQDILGLGPPNPIGEIQPIYIHANGDLEDMPTYMNSWINNCQFSDACCCVQPEDCLVIRNVPVAQLVRAGRS